MGRIRTGILVSGGGSNLQSLIDASQAPDYPAEIVTVIANREEAYGLERARKHGISAHFIDHKAYPDRESFERRLIEVLEEADCEIVCLAGFMRILTPVFIEHWQGRLLNIHPSLLPKYRGLHTHQRALDAGETEAGCTVHLATAELDDGPILEQARVPIEPGDTAETLAARVLKQEHLIYPKALRSLSEQLLLSRGTKLV